MALIESLEKNEVNEIAQKVFKNFEKQTGNVPEWAKVMAHCPNILEGFVNLFNSIMNGCKIEKDLKWKIAYVVSDTLRCKFCVDVTTKMLKKMGASDDELKKIKLLTDLSEKDKEILELVKDVTLDGHLDKLEIFYKLKEKMSECELVEIVSVIGLFNYINRFNNTFAILPE